MGTLRRIAVLAPLLGLLGTLFALGRAWKACPLRQTPQRSESGRTSPPDRAWGPAIAAALPLSAGIVIATLSLVAYDALLIRIEKLAGGLDRLGAETIDAIALTSPIRHRPWAWPRASRDRLTRGSTRPGVNRQGAHGLRISRTFAWTMELA